MDRFLKKYGLENIDSKLLDTALTHKSYANEHDTESYERLEFLGDAILEAIMSEYFYKNFDYSEGRMTRVRSKYICTDALATYSKKMGIIPYIKRGAGLSTISDSIAEDVFESLLAVVYLSFGYEKAREYIYKIIVPYIEDYKVLFSDYKTILQELVQTTRKSLEYVLVGESGPAHDKEFTVEVLVDGLSFGKGVGKSKKDAEQKAAYMALKKQAKFKN